MNEQQLRQRLSSAMGKRLSGLAFDPMLAQRVIMAAEASAPSQRLPRRKVSALLAAALILAALTATAAASGLLGGVFEWLRTELPNPARLGRFPAATEPLGQITVAGVTFTCTEAIADDRAFLYSVAAENASGCDMDADASYQGRTQEIGRAYADGDGRAAIMGEGFHNGSPAGDMTITLSVTRDGETSVGTLTVSPRVAKTLEDKTLAAPIDLGDTGYALASLNLHRTELRTYLSYDVSVGVPPVAIALKQPQLLLTDAQGNQLERWWPYDEPMPDGIIAQLWSGDQTELLYEYALTEQDWKEVP